MQSNDYFVLLEKLKEYIRKDRATFLINDSDWCAGHARAYNKTLEKIAQLELELNNDDAR